jgi:hypothetical protein
MHTKRNGAAHRSTFGGRSPADLPRKPINLSATEAGEAIVARTDPDDRKTSSTSPSRMPPTPS